MSSYEFPFNERLRALLRLEDLFKKVLLSIDAGQQHDHHSALMLLLQMLDLIERADIKVDIVHELDRQAMAMQSLLGNPNISEEVLNKTIKEIEDCAIKIRADNTRVGHTLRENEWLMSIKQRAGIPGGVCQFDLPSYHYWLKLDESRRTSDFNTWLAKLLPMYEGIKIILHILRGSELTNEYTAKNGFYQQMLGSGKPAQMVKIVLLDDCSYFPEVSANKYAINVRFNSMDFVQKPKQCDHDVNFKMTLCNLM
ncbi:MAG: cell division protein ZapD [Methylophilaceae bacterium]